MSRLNKSVFSTQKTPNKHRFETWRESISAIFDVEELSSGNDENFQVEITSHLLDEQVMFCQTKTKGQKFERNPLRNAQDGLDYYLGAVPDNTFYVLSGTAPYIKDRRLHRCASDLTSPNLITHKIYNIAYNWGFASEAHFSRSFKQKFGCTPRDFRSASFELNDNIQFDVGDRYYEQWLRETLKK